MGHHEALGDEQAILRRHLDAHRVDAAHDRFDRGDLAGDPEPWLLLPAIDLALHPERTPVQPDAHVVGSAVRGLFRCHPGNAAQGPGEVRDILSQTLRGRGELLRRSNPAVRVHQPRQESPPVLLTGSEVHLGNELLPRSTAVKTKSPNSLQHRVLAKRRADQSVPGGLRLEQVDSHLNAIGESLLHHGHDVLVDRDEAHLPTADVPVSEEDPENVRVDGQQRAPAPVMGRNRDAPALPTRCIDRFGQRPRVERPPGDTTRDVEVGRHRPEMVRIDVDRDPVVSGDSVAGLNTAIEHPLDHHWVAITTDHEIADSEVLHRGPGPIRTKNPCADLQTLAEAGVDDGDVPGSEVGVRHDLRLEAVQGPVVEAEAHGRNSMAVLVHFRRLQSPQEGRRFDGQLLPPRATGMAWSMCSKGALWQYEHIPP